MFSETMLHQSNLISGTSSGLGAFLKKEINGCSVYKRDKNNSYSNIPLFNNIIHAACGQPTGTNNKKDYIQSQVLLCQKLASIKHKRFVYISSIDVNQQDRTLYGEMKYQIEQYLISHTNNYLIIRPASLIGPGMRQNTITKIFSSNKPRISLAKNSYYYISFYKDILKLILSNASGIWTVCSHKQVNLDTLSQWARCVPEWGNFSYKPVISGTERNFYHLNNYSLLDTRRRIEAFFADQKFKR